MSRVLVPAASAVLALALLAACTGDPDPAPRPTASVEVGPDTDATASPEPDPSPAPDANSLPALFDDGRLGSDLTRVGTPRDLGPYTQHDVTYRSGRLTITGVLNVPDGDGPFPGVVLAHGYIDPDVYVSGQGMQRELDRLARDGFAVLHTDYRGHAGSTVTNGLDEELRLGYTRDVVAAVEALGDLDEVGRVGVVGRSMGGGVTLNALVARPDLVDAAVVYASVSSDFEDNVRHWTEGERPERAAVVLRALGDPEQDRSAWDAVSSRTYLDRVEADVMMHHGTLDASCPYPWAQATRAALQQAGVDLTFHAYEGEAHTFTTGWETSIRRTSDFLRARLTG